VHACAHHGAPLPHRYDYAIVRSHVLFRRARLDLAAELEAISGLLRSHADRAHDGASYERLVDEHAPPDEHPKSLWGRLQAAIRMRGHPDEEERENDVEEGWLGRALDTERRVKRLLHDERFAHDASQRAMEERLMAHIDAVHLRHAKKA
jgi:hypothetical protein